MDNQFSQFGGYTLQGNLVGKDATLLRNQWKEMARMWGMPGVTYMHFVPGTKHFSIHGEIAGTYSEPIPVPMIWMDVPDQETAVTLGWVSELPDDKPYLVQLAYDTPYLEAGCRLSIPFVGDSEVTGGEEGPNKIFRITRVYSISRYPNCRMCQLAPEFGSKLITDIADKPEEKQKNYNYLCIDQNK